MSDRFMNRIEWTCNCLTSNKSYNNVYLGHKKSILKLVPYYHNVVLYRVTVDSGIVFFNFPKTVTFD